ncbi:hypothetical protein IFM89_016653 [Coptis chinensis]|uniref:DUF7950 domain-containing protein n=1 Tax=Coptis chinensis TaxID=261450 RepID=A0A835MBQ4_9MAGN|nr:hypothetical protein IFM89_016653 [Coptis chinensis]
MPRGGPFSRTMIMNSVDTCSFSSKTDQILSRYRPIAPKPLVEGPTTPENNQQSPFSRNNSYLLARPSRRKRGKSGYLPAKRTKTSHHPAAFSSPCGVASLAKNTQLSLSLQGFGHGFPQFPLPNSGLGSCLEKSVNLITLPFLPYPSPSVPEVARSVPELHGVNIYSQFHDICDLKLKVETPKEMDLLQNLQATDSASSNSGNGNVITPQAVRPVGSSISVEYIQEGPSLKEPFKCVSKKPEEVEAEIELDYLPAVVSDSSNRIRLANSAYMEMVGQPECLWLDSMATCDAQSKGSGSACKRIGGKVMLDLSKFHMPSDGFACRVRIEWGSNEVKNSINAQCDVVKLSCESKDYVFTWRFHTRECSTNFKA